MHDLNPDSTNNNQHPNNKNTPRTPTWNTPAANVPPFTDKHYTRRKAPPPEKKQNNTNDACVGYPEIGPIVVCCKHVIALGVIDHTSSRALGNGRPGVTIQTDPTAAKTEATEKPHQRKASEKKAVTFRDEACQRYGMVSFRHALVIWFPCIGRGRRFN